MNELIKFMFYVIVGISILIPIAGIVAWDMEGKKVSFKDWIKNF